MNVVRMLDLIVKLGERRVQQSLEQKTGIRIIKRIMTNPIWLRTSDGRDERAPTKGIAVGIDACDDHAPENDRCSPH